MSEKKSDEVYYSTVKEMAVAIGRSDDYVSDMKKGGFRLPATKAEAIQFIRENGAPAQFRSRTRLGLYGHQQKKKK